MSDDQRYGPYYPNPMTPNSMFDFLQRAAELSQHELYRKIDEELVGKTISMEPARTYANDDTLAAVGRQLAEAGKLLGASFTPDVALLTHAPENPGRRLVAMKYDDGPDNLQELNWLAPETSTRVDRLENKVEKGEYLMSFMTDSITVQVGMRAPGNAVSPLPAGTPAWVVGLCELDAHFRGRAINHATLSEIEHVVKNLVATAMAVGDIDEESHREVLSKLAVTHEGGGAIRIAGIDCLMGSYNARRREREALRDAPVPALPVGTVRRNYNRREVWDGAQWKAERLNVRAGYYKHAAGRVAYLQGIAACHSTHTAEDVAVLTWVDTNELFYVPASQFEHDVIWKLFEG